MIMADSPLIVQRKHRHPVNKDLPGGETFTPAKTVTAKREHAVALPHGLNAEGRGGVGRASEKQSGAACQVVVVSAGVERRRLQVIATKAAQKALERIVGRHLGEEELSESLGRGEPVAGNMLEDGEITVGKTHGSPLPLSPGPRGASSDGTLGEARGPFNRFNGAVEWASDRLREWGKGFATGRAASWETARVVAQRSRFAAE
jgi:hypothetical protein